MARYTWIVRAYSPRDGGWVRLFGYFPSAAMAGEASVLFAPLYMQDDACDYEGIEVKRTIRFH